jgi:hypothetical protein
MTPEQRSQGGDQSPRNAKPLIDLKAWGKKQGWDTNRVDRAADSMWRLAREQNINPTLPQLKMWMALAQQKGLLD